MLLKQSYLHTEVSVYSSSYVPDDYVFTLALHSSCGLPLLYCQAMSV